MKSQLPLCLQYLLGDVITVVIYIAYNIAWKKFKKINFFNVPLFLLAAYLLFGELLTLSIIRSNINVDMGNCYIFQDDIFRYIIFFILAFIFFYAPIRRYKLGRK